MFDKKKISDEKLIYFICKNDKQLYSEIIKRYEKKLMRYVFYLLQDNEQAQDVVQETFIKAYINLKSFNPKKKFSSWIYRIAHNEAINILNKTKKHVRIREGIEFESDINVEDEFFKKELKHIVHKCLGQLPILYREPLTLFYLEEKSYEEISDILRLPVGTVGVRINRAKILMKKICQKLKR